MPAFHTTPSRPTRTALRLRLTPLAAALAVALPPAAGIAAGPVVVTPPPVTAVPVPGATWRTYGTGGAGPINVTNTHGGVDQTITQTSQKAIYDWQSFDIGANSNVTFDMSGTGYSALNRVTGGGSSQIFGGLHATKGGEVYLINQNGILFGATAVVDTGSLIASALDVTDSNFKSSLFQSITAGADLLGSAAFRYTGDATNFVDTRNFVQVDPGAQITSASGGRVFLFAKRVDNAGTITTPEGQTALAAGSEIFLRLPTSRLGVYASESNAAVPVLRGLLVEVGDIYATTGGVDAQVHTGTVTNEEAGHIVTARGNTTLVGMAVNQLGRITATTSVSENGTIFLRAQGGAQVDGSDAAYPIAPTQGGALTLGAHSTTEVLPDTTLVDGKVPTSTDTAGFTTSRIDLLGKTVELQGNAAVVAHGGIVNVRAETSPDVKMGAITTTDANARVVMDAGASIDVSGTTDSTESVARWFVTTDLLTSSDLQDAPLQKDGVLYRAKTTIDVRRDSKILGDLGRYRDSLGRTVDERLSSGGTVRIAAQGGVLLAAGSRIDVSGGQVRYTDALVRETELLTATGGLYNLNDAPVDQLYTIALNLQKVGLNQYDRWGILGSATTTPQRLEQGYVDGRAAGSLSIAAPSVVMQSTLAAHTVQGERQQQGLDAKAAGGRLTIGNAGGFDKFEGFDIPSTQPLLDNFTLGAYAPSAPWVWSDPLHAALPTVSGANASNVLGAGFTTIAVQAIGAVSLDAGASSTLADGSSLALRSKNGDVSFSGHLRDRAGAVELSAPQGRVDVADGATIDLSGAFLNELLDGPLSHAGLAGGTFVARGAAGVRVGTGATIDVSGGVDVTSGGALAGGSAGAITLLAGRSDLGTGTVGTEVPEDQRNLVLDGTLRGQALQGATGGTLNVRSSSVRIGAAGADDPVAALSLGNDFFTRGGFSGYAVDGLLFLDVAAGTALAPSRDSWYATNNTARLAATGSRIDDVLSTGRAPLTLAPGVNLALQSSGLAGAVLPTTSLGGRLTVGAGSHIDLQPGAAFSARAADVLVFDGALTDHGGSVSLTTTGQSPIDQANVLWIGSDARIDVSGTTVVTPSTDGLRRGTVQDGGSIALNASGGPQHYATSLVIQQGAALNLDGTAATLDVTQQSGSGGITTTPQVVASHGGTLAITGTTDLVLEGSVSAKGGSAAAGGGSISVTLVGGRDNFSAENPLPLATLPALTLQQARTTVSAALTPDALPSARAIAQRDQAGGSNATVSADWVAASGAADLTLNAAQTLQVAGNVNLSMARNLVVDAAAISLSPGANATLSGATTVWSNARQGINPNDGNQFVNRPPAATNGTGTLTLHGKDVVLDGALSVQGATHVVLRADHDLQLRATRPDAANQGRLDVAAGLTVSAGQVYPATGQSYTLAATGHDVEITGGDASRPLPLSAGGHLEIDGVHIVQDGVLRAPFGSIALNGTASVTLGDHSVTSVSGDGLTVLGGETQNGGTAWFPPTNAGTSTPSQALPGKTITLTSPTVTTAAGATVDLHGGGTVLADEFIPGPGGSHNVFTGGDGSYAIVPGASGLAAYDPSNAAGSAAALGRQIVIGPGAGVPAGTYTLLPARYALLPGAYLVKPVSGTPLAYVAAVTQPDGSTVIGARLGSAGTGIVSSLSQSWRVQTRDQALKSSEIKLTSADDYFAHLAASNSVAAPRGAADGGVLQVTTTVADLAGRFRFDGARDANGNVIGHGGIAGFSAAHIVVGDDSTPATAGTLTLSASQLNAMAPDSLLLGATVGGATAGGTALTVVAQDVRFANHGTELSVGDLTATATGSVTVEDHVSISARPVSANPSPVASYTINASGTADGDGAALRVSNQAGAGLTRTASTRDTGTLVIGDGASLRAPTGTLVLDGTLADTIAGNARLQATDITLAAGRVLVGAGAATDSLVLGPGLLGQVDNATSLTVRGYDRVAFQDASVLGSDTLKRITLDTGRLLAFDANASVTAGEVHLANTTGSTQSNGTGGTGTLTVHADTSHGGSGRIVLDDGVVSVNGAGTFALNADTALVLAGTSRLAVGGDLAITTPQVISGTPAPAADGSTRVADATLAALGAVSFERPAAAGASAAAPVASSLGASLAVTGQRIQQDASIDLASGQLAFTATGGDVVLGAGSHTSVAGTVRTIDGTAFGTSGGSARLDSTGGNVTLASGATLDVSAGSGAAGGQARFDATTGTVTLAGTLVGHADGSAAGASLVVDAQAGPSLGRIAAIEAGSARNFDGALDLRQRGAGTVVLAAGQTLKASSVTIENDGGDVQVQGTIDASGRSGGAIDIAARDSVNIVDGGTLNVRATGEAAGVPTAGGRIDLTAGTGHLTVATGSTLDLRNDAASALAGTAGGRLTLRAARTGIDASHPGGTNVAVNTIGGQVLGASAVDVQAVQVYDGIARLTGDASNTTAGTLTVARIAADSAAFLGDGGAHADAMAARIAGTNAALLGLMRVHGEAEVRATGSLVVSSPVAAAGLSDDLALPTESAVYAGTSPHVGDTSLTLRAAGDVSVSRSIDMGFSPSATGSDTRAATATSDHSGNLVIVAGADLGAAGARRTVAGHGSLTATRTDQPRVPFSDAYNIVALRATTGDVRLAAGNDIALDANRTFVYTVGRDATDAGAQAVRDAVATQPGTFAFRAAGGDVSLEAGRDVRGNDALHVPEQTPSYEELSTVRSAITSTTVDTGNGAQAADAWTLALGQAQHGVFSFGGGRIDVSAGQDVRSLVVAAPSSGYVLRDATGAATDTRVVAGGSVRVSAGRDVTNGLVEAGGASLGIAAGRDVGYKSRSAAAGVAPGLRVVAENTAATVTARRDLDVGRLAAAFYTGGEALTGLDGQASATLQAAGGDLDLRASQELTYDGNTYALEVLPARTRLQAPGGDVRLGGTSERGLQPGTLAQFPTFGSAFDVLAGRDVTVVEVPGFGASGLVAGGTPDLSNGPQHVTGTDFVIMPVTAFDQSDRSAVHIAGERDVTLGSVDSARSVRVTAGRDLMLDGPVSIRHEATRFDAVTGDAVATTETSVLEAGRDLTVRANGASIDIAGQGELLVLAGRNVDFGVGDGLFPAGVVASGNTRNASTSALAAKSANVTVIAGLRADGSDYARATSLGFGAIGANGLTDRAGDLYALLSSTGADVVPLGSTAATAFDAGSLDQRLAQVKTLLGAGAYDASLASYVRTLPGKAGLSDSAALLAFAALSDAQRDAAPGVVLSSSFAGQPAARRDAFVAEIATANGTKGYGTALADWMKGLDGKSRTIAQAVADFEALPLDRRIPWLDTVLISEIRADGRAAAASIGADQQAAYARGYRTIAALFPVDGADGSLVRPAGDLDMPQATLKTVQGGNITVLTPGGNVNAGGVGATNVPANNLGLVTIAGGDISSVVQGDFLVNRSRVFTLAQGNVLIWSSDGNIDAGRGAKTITGAPAPVLRFDPGTNRLYLDTTGSFTGSGIAVLDKDSALDLYAPAGAIDAGEAGIKSAGNAFFAAQTFIGTDNLSVGGASVGAPPATSAVGATAKLAAVTPDLSAATSGDDESREERRKRKSKRQLLLEFLGFGAGT
jgi:filamentous hemagglutinin family protein